MRNTIAALLAAAALAGCEGNAVPDHRSFTLTREGVLVQSPADSRSVTLELPGWLWAGEPHLPPALALGPNGEAVITSNVAPTLWRVDPRTLAVSVHPLVLDTDTDKDVGFASIAYDPKRGAFIAYSDIQRSVWKIDRRLETATKIARPDLAAGND
jgi:hypothetical protein